MMARVGRRRRRTRAEKPDSTGYDAVGPISARNRTDFGAEVNRSRRGSEPISARNRTDLGEGARLGGRASDPSDVRSLGRRASG